MSEWWLPEMIALGGWWLLIRRDGRGRPAEGAGRSPARRGARLRDTSRRVGTIGHVSSRNGDSRVQSGICYTAGMNLLPSMRNAILRAMEADGAPQRLAMEVVSQPRDQRDGLIRGLRILYCEGIAKSGQSRQTAGMLGDVLEAKLREQVADIEARGGGTVGTA